jgi:hypothetical protein
MPKQIERSEIHRYVPELQKELDEVCASPSFRTSPKSCEFLRHIMCQALNGNFDELKERLIGIALLGRETTYDTGSDAGVRVRANDVRKRLNAYHAGGMRDSVVSFDLPAGSYVPRFFREVDASEEAQEGAGQPDSSSLPQPIAPLALQHLAMPTLVALFLCTICMRWQFGQEQPFVTFWQTVFQNQHAAIYLHPAQANGQGDLVSMETVEATAPLLNLAGQFHSQLSLAPEQSASDPAASTLISVGSAETASSFMPADSGWLAVRATPAGRRIIDAGNRNLHLQLPERAGLLTIFNGAQRSIVIDGTDEAATREVIETLCTQSTFPESVAEGLREGTITQIVFPADGHSEPMVFHEPSTAAGTAVASIQ